MSDYKANPNVDASRLTADELDAMTASFRYDRLPIEAQSKLANSNEVQRETARIEHDKQTARIVELEAALAAVQVKP